MDHANLRICAVVIALAGACDNKDSSPTVAPASSPEPVDSAETPPANAAAECAEPQACVDLGLAYFDGSGGKPRDHAMFLAALDRACELGYGASCLSVAFLYWGERYPEGFESYEGPNDKARYPEYLARACEATTPASHGCNILGVLHAKGEAGVSRDVPKAVQWFTRGCELQLPTSCFELGLLYETEPTAGGTLDQARALYEQACAQRDGKACNNLGFMYERGEGVAQDKTKAVEYYEQACAAGLKAQYCG